MPDKIPGDLQYQPPFSVMWDLFPLPVNAPVYIHHSGIWRVSWSPGPCWALTGGMEKTDTSISQCSCQNHEERRKGRRSKSTFFSVSVSRCLLCFLIPKRIHCPAVLLSLCERKWVREWVCVHKCLWVLCFSVAVNEHFWSCVCVCLFCHASVCIFRAST